MGSILLGITLILWALQQLGMAAISPTLLGIFALITGIVFLVSGFGVAIPTVPIRRHTE